MKCKCISSPWHIPFKRVTKVFVWKLLQKNYSQLTPDTPLKPKHIKILENSRQESSTNQHLTAEKSTEKTERPESHCVLCKLLFNSQNWHRTISSAVF